MMDINLAKSIYSYDSATGNFAWRVDRGYQAKAGNIAGTTNALGYRCIRLEGKQVLGHRLAWAMTYGMLPSQEIDHVNGDPSDNRLENLREASHQQNMINRCMPANNTSGMKGVSIHKQSGRWRARIKNPKGKYEHIGMYDSAEFAHAAYQNEALKLHGEYARKEN